MTSPARIRTRASTPVALAALMVTAAVGCGGGTPAVKANGCTATVSGHSGGRDVVTYSDATHDPNVASPLEQAAARWNASGVHVLLQSAASGGTISFVSTTGPTHTSSCTSKNARSVTVYLDSKTFAPGATTKNPPPNLVARQLGHALGLAVAGPCGALMTKACKKVPPGPDPAEVAEINKLYAGG